MNISSRTPDGESNRCPICGNDVRISPSQPAGDAPCPNCGNLLWFVDTPAGPIFFSKIALRLTDSPTVDVNITDIEQTFQAGAPHQKTDQSVNPDDRVRIVDGYFQNFEGVVQSVDKCNGRVTVAFSIFGRVTPVEVELWQVEYVG